MVNDLFTIAPYNNGADKTSNYPEEAYIVIADNKYMGLINPLIDSLYHFSTRKVIINGINCELPDKYNKYNNIIFQRLNIAPCLNESDFIFKILHVKALACRVAIENGLERGVYLDGDTVARENVDTLFEHTYLYSGARLKEGRCPLFGRHVFDFMIFNGELDREKKLMDLWGVESKTVALTTSMVFSFNKDCYDFLTEWWGVCSNDDIFKEWRDYCPLGDETSANVLLWKHHATECLPISHLNVDSFDTVSFFEESDKVNFDIEHRWNHIPNQKETVKFFHGIKNKKVAMEILDHLKRNFYNRLRITCSRENNKC